MIQIYGLKTRPTVEGGTLRSLMLLNSCSKTFENFFKIVFLYLFEKLFIFVSNFYDIARSLTVFSSLADWEISRYIYINSA